MSDIDKQETAKRPRGRPKGSRSKPDGRRNNRGVKGNAGNRQPKSWQPARKVITDRTTGRDRQQTQEEAWADAKALIRHMTAMGYPVDVMGRFLQPVIYDDDTVRKHFAWELENGRMQADLQVGGVAFRMATSGRHESSTWKWLERRVKGFENKATVGFDGPVFVQWVPGDDTL